MAKRSRTWSRRGSATVELALLAPLFVALLLWVNYFWEVQRARLKAAELARFVAFERIARSDLTGIVGDAQRRYQDLDGATKDGELGSGYRNGLALQASMQDVEAPLKRMNLGDIASMAGASGSVGGALAALGSTPEQMARRMGLDTRSGAVEVDVEVRMENHIIPRRIALYTTGFSDSRLDLVFREHFYLQHDTWKAWRPGDAPHQSYERVEQLTRDRVRPIVYAGAANSGILNAISNALRVLQLDSPFDAGYIRDSIRLRPVEEPGVPTVTATRMTPGDVLEAAYWLDDTDWCLGSCEPQEIQMKRGLISASDDRANWPMRAYRCRGPYFQGARETGLPEAEYVKTGDSKYFLDATDACTGAQSPEEPD
ncbi:TadE family protein [Corallococcus carmarthensis]|uniref:Pilus assembly protein n=1 Tax=Corallococcus carmarthensis TaxID=2316728 RepID=A0A3A8KFV3_9BACT|nr:TadE family protein [Corallococcus carmarthensis]NOK19260.1 pilus assembly protein [Corallococcus carmarthensis]RKH00724.1 pilus assembly protein [Corallococcus carmarthensis]